MTSKPYGVKIVEWEVSLSDNHGRLYFGLPLELSKALKDRGYNKATLKLTSKGILMIPHTGEVGKHGQPSIEVVLPKWDSDAV